MHREFSVGGNVYLRVRPRNNSLNRGSCAKMSQRYCGPFEVLARIRLVVFRISFPSNTKTHNVFHVSLLKKYVHDPNHVIQVEPKGEFQIDPMCILDRKVTMIRNRSVVHVKVQW